MALEKGIDTLVQAFIAAGRPSARSQSIDDRRAGYIASTALAGETETRVDVETLNLEASHIASSLRQMLLKSCRPLSTTTGDALSAAASILTIINCAS